MCSADWQQRGLIVSSVDDLHPPSRVNAGPTGLSDAEDVFIPVNLSVRRFHSSIIPQSGEFQSRTISSRIWDGMTVSAQREINKELLDFIV